MGKGKKGKVMDGAQWVVEGKEEFEGEKGRGNYEEGGEKEEIEK